MPKVNNYLNQARGLARVFIFDPGKGQGTDPRHPILICIVPSINMYILPSYCSYDDDSGSKRDAEWARY